MTLARWILLAGWTLFVIHTYPGLVSPEAIVELGNARRGEFISGVEPASVTALWAMFDFVIAGPFGMIAAASLCFLGGTFSLAKRGLSTSNELSRSAGRSSVDVGARTDDSHAESRVELSAALIAVGVLLFPPVLVGMSIASGFMLFAGFAILGAALVAGDCRWARTAGFVLLSLAAAMRFGGWVGTLPLVFAMPLQGALARRIAIAVGLWAATFAVAFALGRAVEHGDTGQRVRSGAAMSFGEALVTIPSPTSRETQTIASLRQLEIQTGHGRVQHVTDAVMRELPVIMIPIVYVVLALVLLVWLRRDLALRWLVASGLAVEASQLYFAGDGLYERSHWLVATVAISGGIAIVRTLQREPVPA